MHLAVETRVSHDLGAVRLQRAAVVVQAHPGHTSDEPVRDTRRNAPRPNRPADPSAIR